MPNEWALIQKYQFLRIHKKRAKLQFFFEIYKFICTFAENLTKMIIGLLISILSVSYTVVSSTQVESSGSVPETVTAHYQRSSTTGQKGQMTAGNWTMLEMEGWDGFTIDSVVLTMRSNKAAGAGSLDMHIGNEAVWTIKDADFSHANWNGSFSNEWVEISRWIGRKVNIGEKIKLQIKASKNSLYIDRYTFYYRAPILEANTVQLYSGLSPDPTINTENPAGAGIQLPILADTLPWRFVGWSETEVINADTCPEIYAGGTWYYPKTDCAMWAVYTDTELGHSEDVLTDGDYVFASPFWQRSLASGVREGTIHTAAVVVQEDSLTGIHLSSMDERMVYHVEIEKDSTLIFYHVQSGSPIGYDERGLVSAMSRWHYRRLDDGTWCIYHPYRKDHAMLYLGYGADGMQEEVVGYSAPIILANVHSMGLWAFPYNRGVFTTWPFGKDDSIEDVIMPDFNDKNAVYILHMGGYDVHIQNGKKVIYLPH